MTVQTALGPAQVGPNDFVRTDRGIKWAIKCHDQGGTQFIQIWVEKSPGSWVIDGLQESALTDSFDLYEGDVMMWFTEKLIPALNRWLVKKFPAANTPLTRFEQADVLISTKLMITTNADGTLTASSK